MLSVTLLGTDNSATTQAQTVINPPYPRIVVYAIQHANRIEKTSDDMADNQIVTKKTAAKKASTPKAVEHAPSAPAPATPAAPAAQAAHPSKATSAPKRATKAASKTASAAPTASAKRGKTSAAAAPPKLSDHQGSLRQLATVSEEKRQDMIREAAYYKAEKRNFAPGHDAEDWAAAEREIDELIARARVMTGR